MSLSLAHAVLQRNDITLGVAPIIFLTPRSWLTRPLERLLPLLQAQCPGGVAGNLPVDSASNYTTDVLTVCSPWSFLAVPSVISALTAPQGVLPRAALRAAFPLPSTSSFVLASNITFPSLFHQTGAVLCACFHEAQFGPRSCPFPNLQH